MKRGSFAAGFLTCLLLAGISTTAYAAGIMAERSTHRIFVDGQEVQMEAYSIAIIEIHEDYCDAPDKKLLEQLSALLQSVYVRRIEEAEKSV